MARLPSPAPWFLFCNPTLPARMVIILRMRLLMSVVRSHLYPVSLSVVRRYFILIMYVRIQR